MQMAAAIKHGTLGWRRGVSREKEQEKYEKSSKLTRTSTRLALARKITVVICGNSGSRLFLHASRRVVRRRVDLSMSVLTLAPLNSSWCNLVQSINWISKYFKVQSSYSLAKKFSIKKRQIKNITILTLSMHVSFATRFWQTWVCLTHAFLIAYIFISNEQKINIFFLNRYAKVSKK